MLQKYRLLIVSTLAAAALILAGIATRATKPVVSNNGAPSTATTEKDTKVSVTKANDSSLTTWQYMTETDDLTDKDLKGAGVKSINEAYFEFPYNGGSTLTLLLRRRGISTDAMLIISKGQFMCGTEGCPIKFRFDDGPVKTLRAGISRSGKTDVVFIGDARVLLQPLQTAHRVRVSANFYNEGYETFEFQPGSLDIHRLD